MSREFLTWAFLECTYQQFRDQLARQGVILGREPFLQLPVLPVWKAGAVAQLFGMGADLAGMNLAGQIMPNRPVAAPNGRIPR